MRVFIMQESRHSDSAHMVASPLYSSPRPLAKMWAEAFTGKLAKSMKLNDESLCEILPGQTIHKGAHLPGAAGKKVALPVVSI